MPIATWLKRTQLKRVERKLRRLRARQRQVRDKETKLQKDRNRGSAGDDYARRHDELHHEKETLTKEINHLIVVEERLKDELKAAGEGKATTS